MLARMRKRRRLSVHRYAQDYLRTSRLPAGVPALLREWERTWNEDDIMFGDGLTHPLVHLLDPYRKPWFGA